MKRFSFLIIFFVSMRVCAIGFELHPGHDKIDGIQYYTLAVKNSIGKTNIDVALEGNANTAEIKDYLVFTCEWGVVEGVKVGMSSGTNDGVMDVWSYYFFDDKLNNFFSKSYAVMNEREPYTPLSLNHSVCKRDGEGVKKDSRTGKDYIEDYEVIAQGPFALKGVPDILIKYVVSEGVSLIKESELGDVVIDLYKKKENMAPVNSSVFFMNISSKMNVISLMSWGKGGGRVCYKVYAYTYDLKGNFSINTAINSDENLSGCEEGGSYFSFKNAVVIKSYINKTYNIIH